MTEANFLNVANVVGTKAKLGERGDELDAIAMHSNVAYYLQQVGMLVFSSSALSSGSAITFAGGGIGISQAEVPFFAGLRVVIDDQLTAPPRRHRHPRRKYPVFLFKSGVVSEGIQQDLRLAADRNILSMQDVLAVDYHYGYHVTGTKWNVAGDNPDQRQHHRQPGRHRQLEPGVHHHQDGPRGPLAGKHTFRCHGLLITGLA